MSNGFYTQLTDRAVLKIDGADARDFLQGLITNDVERANGEQAIYAALLTPQGKILFDFFIAKAGEAYLLDCAAPQAAELAKRLTFYRLRAQVDITNVSDTLCVASIWSCGGNCGLGDDAGKAAPFGSGVLYVDPRSAAAGVRAIINDEQLAELAATHQLDAADLADYHSNRILLGIADSSADIGSGELFPHETNLDQLNGVDFKKGCYVGQEVVSRTEHRSTARKRMIPVDFTQDAPATGSDVRSGDKSIGTLLSSSGSRAIALVRLDRAKSAIDGGTTIEAEGLEMTLRQPDWARFDVPGAGN